MRYARKGDFDVAVQLAHSSKVNDYTRGGLMVREDLSGKPQFLGVHLSGDRSKRWASTVRFVTGGPTTLAPGNSYVLRLPRFAYPDAWLRLKRVANTSPRTAAPMACIGCSWVSGLLLCLPILPLFISEPATTPNSSAPGRAAAAQY